MTQPIQLYKALTDEWAPPIEGGYPSAPLKRAAWQAAYAILGQAGRPVHGTSLAVVVNALVPGVSVREVRDLLNMAARHGLIRKFNEGAVARYARKDVTS